MGYRLNIFIMVAVCIFFWVSTAWADLHQEIVEAMQRGAQYYAEEEYSAAVDEFFMAYKASIDVDGGPYAILLFNAARAAQVGGEREWAFRYFEEALKIDGMNALPATERTRAKGAMVAIVVAESGGLVSKSISEILDGEKGLELDEYLVGEAMNVKTMISTDRRRGFNAHQWVGTGALVSGVGLLITAGIMSSRASRQIELMAGVKHDVIYEQVLASVEQKQFLGRTMLWGGGGLVVTGVALFWWGTRSAGSPAIGLPGIERTSDAVIINLGGSF